MSGSSPAGEGLETVRFPVAGMTCGACVSRITRAVRRLNGVDAVRVDLGSETATVRRAPAAASLADIAAAIAAAGYLADIEAAVPVAGTGPSGAPGGLAARVALNLRRRADRWLGRPSTTP